MDEIIRYLLAGGVGGAAGGGGIGAFLFYLLKRHLAKRDELEAKLEVEKQRQIDRIEKQAADSGKKIDDHLAADNPRNTEEQLRKLSGEVTRLGDTLARNQEQAARDFRAIERTLGEVAGALKGVNVWLGNMNDTVQHHIQDGGKHGGK